MGLHQAVPIPIQYFVIRTAKVWLLSNRRNHPIRIEGQALFWVKTGGKLSALIPYGQASDKFDINPQVPGVIQASADDLPIENESVSSIMFDPPFLPNRNLKTNNIGIMRKRFKSIGEKDCDFSELFDFYKSSTREFYRILNKKGVLVFKCQDSTNSKFFASHVKVYNYAIECGFEAIDLFILLAKSVLIRTDLKQRHARKYHSYFWVFQKQ